MADVSNACPPLRSTRVVWRVIGTGENCFEGSWSVLPPRCPCFGCWTLDERNANELCSVCFWEDDGQNEQDVDQCPGGPKGEAEFETGQAQLSPLRRE